MRIVIILICLVATAAVAAPQERPKADASEADAAKAVAPSSRGNALSAHNRMLYAGVKATLLRSAEKMPEESYNFKPTDAVRSYGQLVGHIAESQYFFCSAALGEKSPARKIELTKTAKADLVAALKEAFAYCDRAYDGMTDATATQTVKLFGGDAPKLGVLNVNNVHSALHYGNLVTYMRMKNIVPPSSEPGGMP